MSWNIPRFEPLRVTRQGIENRKVFDADRYGQGNQGHAFTAVLSDAERREISEYMKPCKASRAQARNPPSM